MKHVWILIMVNVVLGFAGLTSAQNGATPLTNEELKVVMADNARLMQRLENLETDFNAMRAGKLAVAELNVGAITLPGGTITSSGKSVEIRSADGGAVLVNGNPTMLTNAGHRLVMQADGNLVLYSERAGGAIGNTRTDGR
jgi:hypothetical protein